MRDKLKEWYTGHITITIRGKRFERLINLAVRDGLHIWNIRRASPEKGQLDILISDYFRLRPLLKETGCRSHVESRMGLPFWLIRMRLRAGFVIGVLLFFLGLYMLSSFVWRVDIQGAHLLSKYEIEKAAESIGVKRWAWKGALPDPSELQRELLKRLPQASWVGVHIEGTIAIIQVVEKEVPQRVQEVGPRHLVAKKKAVVHSIFAEKGKPRVKLNEFVEKGQVLISGIIGNDADRQALVPARGQVQGEVWYLSNVSVPVSQTTNVYTGVNDKRYYLLAGPYALRLWPFSSQSFEKFEKTEKRFLPSYRQFSLPLGWKTETLMQMQPESKKLSREEAIAIGKKFAALDVQKTAGKNATIKEEKVLQVKEESGKVYLSIHFTVIEEIAEELPITSLPPAPSEGTETPN